MERLAPPLQTASLRRLARGHTLIEMVATIVLVGILAAAVTPMLVNGLRAFEATAKSLTTLSKLRYASERMAREIREVRRNLVTPTNYDITTRNATNFVFINDDGVTVTLNATALPLVRMTYSATPAVSNITLTDQVSAFTFTYYCQDGVLEGTGTCNPMTNANIGFVDINLTLTQDGGSYQQRTRVALRNKQ